MNPRKLLALHLRRISQQSTLCRAPSIRIVGMIRSIVVDEGDRVASFANRGDTVPDGRL